MYYIVLSRKKAIGRFLVAKTAIGAISKVTFSRIQLEQLRLGIQKVPDHNKCLIFSNAEQASF